MGALEFLLLLLVLSGTVILSGNWPKRVEVFEATAVQTYHKED